MTFYPLVEISRLYDGYCQGFRAASVELLLVQDRGLPVLMENRCPHMDARLDRGKVEAGAIRCPVHGIAFNLNSGKAEGPLSDCIDHLKKFPIAIRNGVLGVELE